MPNTGTTDRTPPEGYKTLTEGKACILHKGNDVFYNPAQVRQLALLLVELNRQPCLK